jgi:predicted RNase H-like HicB family nuclease
MTPNNLQLTGIFVQDPIDKGFTAFFAQLPYIIAEGDNEQDATENLIQTVQTVFEHQKNNGFTQPNVITKQFNLSIA